MNDDAETRFILAKAQCREDDPLRRRLSIRLNVMARLQRIYFDRKAVELNMTRSQWTMIAIVSRHPGATQKTIAEYLQMSEASAGRLIDRLCSEGMLERRAVEDDRRARAVYVTEAATPLLEKLGEIATINEERLFAGFSDEELEQFRALSDRMFANLTET